MNKGTTKYNHCKLEFLVNIIEEDQIKDSTQAYDSSNKKLLFPFQLLLEFVEKSIVNREKVLSKSVRENVEKAFMLVYKRTNYDSIKDYTSNLDPLTLSNLGVIIPELSQPVAPVIIPPALVVEEVKTASKDDSPKKMIQVRKERLKNIQLKINKRSDMDLAGSMTDVEKSKNKGRENIYGSKHSATNPVESRNISIDRIKEEGSSIIDKSTKEFKDKIKKNIEMLRSSKDHPTRNTTATRENKRLEHARNITPNKNRQNSSMLKVSRDLKTSERRSKHKALTSTENIGNVKVFILLALFILFCKLLHFFNFNSYFTNQGLIRI